MAHQYEEENMAKVSELCAADLGKAGKALHFASSVHSGSDEPPFCTHQIQKLGTHERTNEVGSKKESCEIIKVMHSQIRNLGKMGWKELWQCQRWQLPQDLSCEVC
jgi:hypothetical protein